MIKLCKNFKGLCLFALFACAVALVTADEDYEDDHSHHGHSSSQTNGTNSTLLNEKQSGANILFQTYNQTCNSTLPPCAPKSNLACSTSTGTGRCICAPAYVYVKDTDTCWSISRSVEDTCAHDVQCHAGKWGALSRCSKHSSKCECYDYSTNGKRDTILLNGICYIEKTRGDLCDNDEECKTMEGEAYCETGNHTGGGGNSRYNGSCQCRESHTWHNPLKKCLKKSTQLNDSCVVSQQCRDGTLGRYSRCHEETATCVCHVVTPDNSTEPVYYKALKKCFPRKAYNETCDEDDECRASLGPDVLCGKTDDYTDENVCHCPKGKVCRSSGFSNILGASSPYTMGVACTAAVIGMTISMNGLGGGIQITSSGGW